MGMLLRFIKSGEWNHEIFATWVALGVLFVYWSLGLVVAAVKNFLRRKYVLKKRALQVTTREKSSHQPQNCLDKLVTEADLTKLIEELDELGSGTSNTGWIFVLDKSNQNVSYFAKRRDPKDGGPTEYLSITTFQNCTAELLRDFYMDNDFRLQWDKTVVNHEQLDICCQTGTEVGRTVKKFPLMMAREYVLAWRLWQGEGNTYYCVIKACEHSRAPRRQEFKRVEDYLSGWRIKPVPGSNACEVKMLHREDIGMSREMAKMAFSRGIWSYVNKMDQNLRKYASMHKKHQSGPDAVTLCKKMNPELEGKDRARPSAAATTSRNSSSSGFSTTNKVSSSNRPQNKAHRKGNECNKPVGWITQSMFLLGWAVFLGHGSTSLGAKIAAAVFMNNAMRRRKRQQKQQKQQEQHQNQNEHETSTAVTREACRYVPKCFLMHHR